MPALGFVDTNLTPGSAYSYRLVARDADGNVVNGASSSITVPTAQVPTTALANQVRADGARIYWPMNQTSGTTAIDTAGANDAVTGTSVCWDRPGAVDSDTAVALNGSDQTRMYASGTETRPTPSPSRRGSRPPAQRRPDLRLRRPAERDTPVTGTATST